MTLPTTTETPTRVAALRTSRLRVRFSLLSLIVLVLLLSSLVLLYISSRETARLQAENRKLRDELGALLIDDPQQTYVRAGKTNEDKSWRWRIYVPQTTQYQFVVAFADIKDAGFPKPALNFGCKLEKGESEIDLKLNLNGKNEWTLHLVSPDSIISDVPLPDPSWLDSYAISNPSRLSQTTQVSKDTDIELLRLRGYGPPVNGVQKLSSNEPAHGLLLWLAKSAPKPNP